MYSEPQTLITDFMEQICFKYGNAGRGLRPVYVLSSTVKDFSYQLYNGNTPVFH